VCYSGEGRAEWRISADTRYGRDWGKFAQREDGGMRLVSHSVFSFGRHHLPVVSIYASRFRARRFEELGSIVMDAGAVKMGLAEEVFFGSSS
jgi:hypothetical protein